MQAVLFFGIVATSTASPSFWSFFSRAEPTGEGSTNLGPFWPKAEGSGPSEPSIFPWGKAKDPSPAAPQTGSVPSSVGGPVKPYSSILDLIGFDFLSTVKPGARFEFFRIFQNATATKNEIEQSVLDWAERNNITSSVEGAIEKLKEKDQLVRGNVTELLEKLPKFFAELTEITDNKDLTIDQEQELIDGLIKDVTLEVSQVKSNILQTLGIKIQPAGPYPTGPIVIGGNVGGPIPAGPKKGKFHNGGNNDFF